jgi:hypothetical protein
LSQKRQFFRWIFRRKYLKIITSVPGHPVYLMWQLVLQPVGYVFKPIRTTLHKWQSRSNQCDQIGRLVIIGSRVTRLAYNISLNNSPTHFLSKLIKHSNRGKVALKCGLFL